MDCAAWTPGVCGDPSKGSRQKRERIVEAAVGALVKLLGDYHSGKLEDGLALWRREVTDELIDHWKFPQYGSEH
jgi:hypothetical protein